MSWSHGRLEHHIAIIFSKSSAQSNNFDMKTRNKHNFRTKEDRIHCIEICVSFLLSPPTKKRNQSENYLAFHRVSHNLESLFFSPFGKLSMISLNLLLVTLCPSLFHAPENRCSFFFSSSSSSSCGHPISFHYLQHRPFNRNHNRNRNIQKCFSFFLFIRPIDSNRFFHLLTSPHLVFTLNWNKLDGQKNLICVKRSREFSRCTATTLSMSPCLLD